MAVQEVNRLFNDNIRLVDMVINRYYTNFRQDDDVKQIGLIGLWQATKYYDANKSKFSTYATKAIYNEIATYLKENSPKVEMIYFEDNLPGQKTVFWKDTIADTKMDLNKNVDYIAAKEALQKYFLKQKPKKQKVIRLAVKGYKEVEIARKMGISTQRVSEIICQLKKNIKGA